MGGENEILLLSMDEKSAHVEPSAPAAPAQATDDLVGSVTPFGVYGSLGFVTFEEALREFTRVKLAAQKRGLSPKEFLFQDTTVYNELTTVDDLVIHDPRVKAGLAVIRQEAKKRNFSDLESYLKLSADAVPYVKEYAAALKRKQAASLLSQQLKVHDRDISSLKLTLDMLTHSDLASEVRQRTAPSGGRYIDRWAVLKGGWLVVFNSSSDGNPATKCFHVEGCEVICKGGKNKITIKDHTRPEGNNFFIMKLKSQAMFQEWLDCLRNYSCFQAEVQLADVSARKETAHILKSTKSAQLVGLLSMMQRDEEILSNFERDRPDLLH